MWAVAIVQVLCVLAAGGVLIYAAVNGTRDATALPVQVIPAAERPDEFARWQTALIRQAVQGTAFQSSMPGSVENYAFYVYTVSVSNKGLLGARMAELQVVPKEGDVLSYSPAASLSQNVNLPVDIPAGTTRNLQCILLTRRGSNAVRELYLTYYIWGRPYTIRLTYG